LSGIPPFNGASDQEIMKKVKSGKFSFADPVWASISAQAKDFITQLLTLDQNKRPSAAQALTHPWITEATKLTTANLQSDVALNALTNL
jgi:calcium-dependent protein kinase